MRFFDIFLTWLEELCSVAIYFLFADKNDEMAAKKEGTLIMSIDMIDFLSEMTCLG